MPTQTDALAGRYARSLFELARDAGGPEKIAELADELEQVSELARSDRGFGEFLASPIIDRSKRAAALQAMFQDRITDLGLRFLLVLNQKGRLGHLEPIRAAYDALVQETQGRVEVDVWTAAPLGAEQKRIIGERIREAIGKEPVLHAYVDASMIGGIRLLIGDRMVDGSIATRLRRLRQSIRTSTDAVTQRLGDFIEGGDAA